MTHHSRLLMCSALTGGSLLAGPAVWAADLYDGYDGVFPAGGLPAVSDVNGKIAGGFGAFDGDGIGFGLGSFSLPIGHAFGLQVDALGGGSGGGGFGGVAGHSFWRDPSRALFGVYGSWLTADHIRFDVAHVAGEAEVYFDRLSLEGMAGLEFGDADTGFFGSATLAYYPLDDLRLYGGYRHVNDINVAAAGFEWQVPNAWFTGLSLYGDGRVSDTRLWAVYGGLRLYLGADKPLIRRHREDDPNGTQLLDDLFGLSPSVASAPTPGVTCEFPDMLIDGVCVPYNPPAE